ncbi:hypothetical protein CEK26_012551 [Fusarium fujikuroi]|uniref:Protein kinase domain-containing protein n=1 Tax=Fusarium fujikuroi TaxID=5127 RepID=A0A2H3SXL6_FUSFU|nr:hypothetical protein CEK27_012563 [Fusarium fujikuroi]QGI85793.1 hypothetical protein CEK25_012522 [Fusarium fujikuroi]QGI99482.1 hypothetical protein CEK26_012551 [Fusarium fujikuroi]SCO25389.1 uncharacterized protein FFC1_15485 [Fusarium fujikuroi]SCO53868.1 uncharacterized protein FFMR_11521 [Fusarium fujikuroi]
MDMILDARVQPPWSVLEFTFSAKDTDTEFVVMYNYRQFIIHASADSLSQYPTLKNKYLFFLKVADKYELDGYTLEDFYDWIIEPLLPELRQVPEMTAPLTLQHFLFPETRRYDIRGDGDKLVAFQSKDSNEVTSIFGIHLPEEICAPWAWYDPKDVHLPEKRNTHGPPSYRPSKSIREAHLPESLRISRLIGLVRDETGRVFGLLLTYIDCGHKTLCCAANPRTARELKQTWAQQVNDTLQQLHAAGIIWGDAKSDNVLIDQKNNAWLIDFGGGYTDGWVPKELSGTMEGDLQGLKKINEFLLDGSL